MELQVNEREALLIVTALGTYQNRVGQHTSWDQRQRLTTLRGRLADCVIIGDKEEAKGIHKALAKTHRRIERGIALGSDMGEGVTGGGLHGKDLSKAARCQDRTAGKWANLSSMAEYGGFEGVSPEDAKKSQAKGDGTSSRLSPLFTEEMMGFPFLWTTLPFLSESGAPKPSKPTATPSYPK